MASAKHSGEREEVKTGQTVYWCMKIFYGDHLFCLLSGFFIRIYVGTPEKALRIQLTVRLMK